MPASSPPRRRSRVRVAALLLVVVEVPLLLAMLVAQLADPTPARAAGEHAFLQRAADGTPVTWDPCSPIGYVVNWDHAPDGAVQLVAEAVDTVEAATGLTFTALGSTRLTPATTRATDALPAGAEVLVAWAPAADDPLFRTGDVVGWARPVPVGPVYGRGQVALDADWYADATPEQARAVLLHELGHLVGLDHVEDTSQLMSDRNVGTEEYQQGDLEGLARLGPLAGPRCA
ncbi:Matrixin [Klenkia soli]|uniref:Matrixin n=1 Tax=Klenkia soli TaxID=1052260 RepID=A0A1H0PX35_9ACTN|nr:matrixin family metalloprotease [Klenkia soli]SDP09692.1 Matrixin [Klenkia soli]